jgi:hypothetical protein
MTNPDTSHYCGNCGAALGRSPEESTKLALRDRRTLEIEIMEAVVGRLMTWAKWLGSIVAVIVALFAILIGKSYLDLHTAVEGGKTQIAAAIQDAHNAVGPMLASARHDAAELQKNVATVNTDLKQVQADLSRYKQVNQNIERLQKQLSNVQGQITQWYQLMETEVFRADSDRLKYFDASPKKAPSCEVTLKAAPIPASVRMIRGYLSIPANEITVTGKTVRWICNKLERPDDFVTVQYHRQP